MPDQAAGRGGRGPSRSPGAPGELTSLVDSQAAAQVRRQASGPGQSSGESQASPAAPRWTVQEYLEAHKDSTKTLVVGCGTTPQHVMMGQMQGGECSRGQSHDKDFTVDLSKDAGADLVVDFVLYSGTDLHNHGKGQFDTVAFEYLNRGSRDRFTPTHIDLWIKGADALLNNSGKVVFYSFHDKYLEHAKEAMLKRGYTVTEHSIPPDGTPANRHGHRYCEGVKPAEPTGWGLPGWLRA